MTLPPLDDTIAALATAPGRAGIGIVRLSGPGAPAILASIFRPHHLARPMRPRALRLGMVVDPGDGTVLDEALAVHMPPPHSYTRQHVVEIQAHGGEVVCRQVLDACLRGGAREAGPGEFTLRAVANGRLNLAEAEAVRDLVAASGGAGAQQAVRQLRGALSRRVQSCLVLVREALVLAEAQIELQEELGPELEGAIRRAAKQVDALAASARSGLRRARGARVCLVGRQNVGKSSLLNALAGEERAIVTDVPGTTRDSLEVAFEWQGLAVTLMDTAGVTDAEPLNTIDALSQARTRRQVEEADLAVVLLACNCPQGLDDRAALELARKAPIALLCWSKADLGAPQPEVDLPEWHAVTVSSSTGAGLPGLRAAIAQALAAGSEEEPAAISSGRQAAAADRAAAAAAAAQALYRDGMPLDMVTEELRLAQAALGEILGVGVSSDVLAEVFASFCVGK